MQEDTISLNEAIDANTTERVSWISPAKLAIISCVVAWALLLAGLPIVLRYFFLASSLLCSLYLSRKHPIQYVAFTWWLYILTPFMRRLVDYRVGYDATNLMLAAPLFATAVACPELPKLHRLSVRSLPFALGTCAAVYGLGISVAHRDSFMVLAQYFVSWISPVAFGYYIYVHRELFPQIRDAMQQTFKWGLLIAGIYGVIQYLFLLPWDTFWMIAAGPPDSFGAAAPLELRVFSTMNAPQVLGMTLVFGLLFIMPMRMGLMTILASAAAYASLLLTMARSAWVELVVGVLMFVLIARSKKVLATVLATCLITGGVVAAITMSPIGDRLQQRFDSMKDVQDDGSKQEREDGYEKIVEASLNSPLGSGWGLENSDDLDLPMHDSTVTESLMTTGWFGVAAFYLVLIFGIGTTFSAAWLSGDRFMAVLCAILMAIAVASLLNSFAFGIGSVMLWSCLGLGLGVRAEKQSGELVTY